MADTADIAADDLDVTTAAAVSHARVPIAAGTAGECDGCEWWFPRLVGGLCGFCRDGRPHPPDWEPPRRPDQPAKDTTREKTMATTKSIMLPACATAAIEAVDAYAKENNTTIGAAAAALIELGALPPSTPPSAVFTLEEHLATVAVDDLLAELGRRMTAPGKVESERARADAAESENETLREVLAAANATAAAAIAQVDAVKALLAA